MAFLAFLVGAGGGYALAHDGLGLSVGWSSAVGWAVGIALWYLAKKWRGYRAAFRVERYRAAAAQLRRDDPETYQQILLQARGSEAEAAAMHDPDAYVALFLFEAERMGYGSGAVRVP